MDKFEINIFFLPLSERVTKALQLMKTYESPMLFWFFHIPAIVLGKAEDIQVNFFAFTITDLQYNNQMMRCKRVGLPL